jgi:hypothetical protein
VYFVRCHRGETGIVLPAAINSNAGRSNGPPVQLQVLLDAWIRNLTQKPCKFWFNNLPSAPASSS